MKGIIIPNKRKRVYIEKPMNRTLQHVTADPSMTGSIFIYYHYLQNSLIIITYKKDSNCCCEFVVFLSSLRFKSMYTGESKNQNSKIRILTRCCSLVFVVVSFKTVHEYVVQHVFVLSLVFSCN